MCRHRIAIEIAIGYCLVAPVWAQSVPAPELPEGTTKAKATTACTECHDSRIILQQRLSKAAWTKEVDKMTKWGALVDAQDRDALIDYLSSNFGVDKPEYVPERTRTAESKHKK
jgi:hypothetical protein